MGVDHKPEVYQFLSWINGLESVRCASISDHIGPTLLSHANFLKVLTSGWPGASLGCPLWADFSSTGWLPLAPLVPLVGAFTCAHLTFLFFPQALPACSYLQLRLSLFSPCLYFFILFWKSLPISPNFALGIAFKTGQCSTGFVVSCFWIPLFPNL